MPVIPEEAYKIHSGIEIRCFATHITEQIPLKRSETGNLGERYVKISYNTQKGEKICSDCNKTAGKGGKMPLQTIKRQKYPYYLGLILNKPF